MRASRATELHHHPPPRHYLSVSLPSSYSAVLARWRLLSKQRCCCSRRMQSFSFADVVICMRSETIRRVLYVGIKKLKNQRKCYSRRKFTRFYLAARKYIRATVKRITSWISKMYTVSYAGRNCGTEKLLVFIYASDTHIKNIRLTIKVRRIITFFFIIYLK